MKLIDDVNEACGVELTVRSLLVEPTLGALVREVEQARGEAAAAPGPPDTPAPAVEVAAPLAETVHPPLVPIRPEASCHPSSWSQGEWAAPGVARYARRTRYLNPGQPFYGLRARGVDDLVEPHESVEAMATEHLKEIRKVQPRGPYYISGSCVGGVVAFELAQQLRAAGEEVRLLVLIDSNYPTRPRMIRNQVVNLWKDTLPPGVARPGGLRGVAARAQDRARVLFSPTEEQRVGMRRSAIGNRYLRRIRATARSAMRAGSPSWPARCVRSRMPLASGRKSPPAASRSATCPATTTPTCASTRLPRQPASTTACGGPGRSRTERRPHEGGGDRPRSDSASHEEADITRRPMATREIPARRCRRRRSSCASTPTSASQW